MSQSQSGWTWQTRKAFWELVPTVITTTWIGSIERRTKDGIRIRISEHNYRCVEVTVNGNPFGRLEYVVGGSGRGWVADLASKVNEIAGRFASDKEK